MPDIFYLIKKYWKRMLLVIILAVAVAATIVFTQPATYLSVATALPANPALMDKASIFNSNIQNLYSSMGGADELDVILGTAQLDTVYLSVTDAFNLWDHYKPKGEKEELRFKSATILKKNTRVIKSDFGELKVKVWDKDKNLAPQLANAIMDKLNAIHQSIKNASNGAVLENLKKGRLKIAYAIDSSKTSGQIYPTQQASLADQLQQYEKLIGEYQLLFDSKPSVLIMVEQARVAERPDRQGRWVILAATAFLAFLFTLLVVLVLEGRKMKV